MTIGRRDILQIQIPSDDEMKMFSLKRHQCHSMRKVYYTRDLKMPIYILIIYIYIDLYSTCTKLYILHSTSSLYTIDNLKEVHIVYLLLTEEEICKANVYYHSQLESPVVLSVFITDLFVYFAAVTLFLN